MGADKSENIAFGAWRAFGLVIIVAALYAGVWLHYPHLTAGSSGNDILFLADGARRIAAGQIPHVDFSLPTGVLPYLLYAWSERFLSGLPAYIGLHLLDFLLVAPLLVAGVASLPSRGAGLALVLFAAIAILLPFNSSAGEACGTSLFASYNRFGTGLTLVYFAWFFRARAEAEWLNGILIAWATLVVIFTKFVFLGALLGPVFIYGLCDARWRRSGLIALVIVLTGLAAIQIGTGIVSGYWSDIRAMAAVNSGHVAYFLGSFIFKSIFELALLAAVVLMLLAERWRIARRISANRIVSMTTLAAICQPAAMAAALAGLVVAESQATGGIEMAGALGLLFAPGLAGTMQDAFPNIRGILFVASLTLIGGHLIINAFQKGGCDLLNRQGAPLSLSWAQRFLPHIVVPKTLADQAVARAALTTQAAGTMRAIEANGFSFTNARDFNQYLAQWKAVDDAIGVLNARGLKDLGRVTTLAVEDMFGLALHAEPPKGLKVVLDVGRTVSPMNPSQADAYLRNVDTIFVPTCPMYDTPGFEPAAPWFDGVLAKEFNAEVLTPCWSIFRRNNPAR